MDIYERFGERLRSLCKQRGTIRQVSEEIGINRQQFSRYLNGENFPRRETLKLICDYFGISDQELFSDNKQLPKNMESSPIVAGKDFWEIVTQLEQPQQQPVGDGMYLTYFHTLSTPDWLMRSLTVVKTSEGITTFRRLTGFSEERSSPWRLSLGHHRGIVLERRGFIYFCALDKLASQTPTLNIMRWSPTKLPILKGKGIALTVSGAEVCDLIMEKLEDGISLRMGLEKCGAVGIKEQSVPTHIKQLLSNF